MPSFGADGDGLSSSDISGDLGEQQGPLPPPTLTSEGWKEYGPFEEDVRRAHDRYGGSLSAASLDVDNAGPLFDIVLRGPFADAAGTEPTWIEDFDWLDQLDDLPVPTLHSSPSGNAFAIESGPPEPCDEGGTRRLVALESIGGPQPGIALDVRFDDCVLYDAHGMATYTLDGGWRRTIGLDGDAKGEAFASFDGLAYLRHGKRWVLDGAISWTEYRCESYAVRATLAIVDPDGGTAVLLDDVVARFTGEVEFDEGCFIRPAPNLWNGAIAHQEHGRVELRTPLPLDRPWNDRWQEATVPSLDASGPVASPGLEMIGGDDTRATFSVPETGLAKSFVEGADSKRVARLRLARGDAVVLDALASLDELATGALSDLTDSDEDGLSDGWELVYGMDPETPLDAATDIDGDGLDALEEYALLSEPDDAYSTPHVVGQRIGVSAFARPDLELGSPAYEVVVTVERPFGVMDAVDDAVTVSFSGNAVWHDIALPERCSSDGEAVIRCAVRSLHSFNQDDVFVFDSLVVLPKEEESIEVNVVHPALPWQGFTQRTSLSIDR